MLIRKARKEDAEGILTLVKQVMNEVDYFPGSPEEFEYTVETEEEFIENVEHMLVCLDHDKIVGSSTLIRGKYQKMAHSANFGITIAKAYTNQGLGSKILEKMIEHAKAHGIERIELEVFEDNIPGIKLYEKFGFKVEGKKEKAIKTNKGYQNLLLMAKFV